MFTCTLSCVRIHQSGLQSFHGTGDTAEKYTRVSVAMCVPAEQDFILSLEWGVSGRWGHTHPEPTECYAVHEMARANRSTLMHNLNCVHFATSVTLGKETGLSFVCIKSFFTVLEKMYNITLGLDEMSFHSLIRSRVWFLTNAVKVIEALRKFFNSMYSWIYVEQNVLVPCLKSE